MKVINCKKYISAFGLLLLMGSAAHATKLFVDCGGKAGLSSIGEALKILQSPLFTGPNTINVSGACAENVVIQSMNRVTLNALKGASITDVSGGTSDVILIDDSRDVAINNFTINGGDNGIDCTDGSVCRLSGNTIQGAAGAGAIALVMSQMFVTSGTLTNNGAEGLAILNGSSGNATGVAIENNALGVVVRFQAFLVTNATIVNNSGGGAYITTNATFHCNGCSVTGNGGDGVLMRRNSSAMFENGYVITGNTGPGVAINEVSSGQFVSPGTVTGNSGGTDVLCATSFTTARGATTNVGGGITNCVEPPL
jgi:hypothetical protein